MRLQQLDSVRAIAIAAVFVEHFAGEKINALIPVGAGSLGVGCFFALSGFLITSSLVNEFRREGASRGRIWINFYARRFLRLLPAFYLWILALCLLDVQVVKEAWLWHAAYLSNVWIALGHPMTVFWSLAVEEQFYLFWPFVIAFAPRRWLIHVIILTTIVGTIAFKAAFGNIPGFSIQTLLFANMTELGFGAIMAVLCHRGGKPYQFDWITPRMHRDFTILAAVCAVAAVAIWAAFGGHSHVRRYLNDIFCSVAFCWLILNAAIGFKGVVGAVFANGAVRFVGQISYGLYLVHNFIPGLVERYIGPMPKWQAAPLVLAITFAICIFSWFCIEKPVLKLKRFFESDRTPPGGMDPRAVAGVAAPVADPGVEPAPSSARS